MRCKTCDYSLWGMTGRTCPECGSAFKPSDFDLIANAVRFLCPHCRQQYYGTAAKGHLDPLEFDCVTCGAHIHMDEMVLEPREGVADHRTRATQNPWLERPRLRMRSAYYRTIGRSIGTPAALARATPESSRVWTALGYYAIHAIFIAVLSVLPIAVLMAAMFPSGHRGAWHIIWPILGVLAVPIAVLLVAPLAWGLATQVLLVFLGGKPTRLGTTYKAIAYSSAPILLCAVPCLGFHIAMIAVPWWIVNTVVMLATMHRIAWWRAAIAHVLGGLIVIGVPIAGITLWVNHVSSTMYMRSSASAAGQNLRSAILLHAQTQATTNPFHLIDTLAAPSWNAHWLDLIASGSISPPDITIAGVPVAIHLGLPAPQRDPIDAELRAAMLASGVHRVGHLVLAYHGFDVGAPPGPDLWIAIVWPDPDSGAVFTHPETVVVILASGVAQDIPLAQFPADLASQNAARVALGIPEIPDPATVRMWPPGSVHAPAPTPAPVP